ncbi:MAG: hypothetical protein WCI76_00015 [bacterium]
MPETKINTKKRLGILRGGAGDHHSSSVKKGGEILLHIHEHLSEKYKPVDILVDRDHIWHLGGLPISPSELMTKVDLVWNTAHSSFSNILDSLSVPNIGAGAFFSNIDASREALRKHIAQIGLSMPRRIVSPKNARDVFEKFGAPWIVKNSNEIKLVKTFDELVEAVNNVENVTVEEFIAGKVASTHSVAKFRGEDVYVFPIGNHFTNLTSEDKQKITAHTKDLHKHLGAKHYLRADFVLTSKGKLYLLNIESIPNLKTGSHFSQVCESVGAKMHELVEHMFERTLVL